MKKLTSLFAVSFVAIAAVSAAHADIASTTYVQGKTGNLQYTNENYVTKGDTLTVAVGKLDAAVKTAATTAGSALTKTQADGYYAAKSLETSAIQTADGKVITGKADHILKLDADGKVVDGGTLGTMATKSTVTSADITNGTIKNEDLDENLQEAIAAAGTALQAQAQADWNQADTEAADYIKNKPTTVSAFTNDANYVAKDGTLTQDHIVKVDANGKLIDAGVKGALANKDTVSVTEIDADAVITAKIKDKNVTKAKLDDTVQASLGKADNSLQKGAGVTFSAADAGKAVVLKTDGTFEIGAKLGTMATESASDYTKTANLGNLATKNESELNLKALAHKDTVSATEIDADAVITAKIKDKNVTKAKLDDTVQASLDKADNSLQKGANVTFTAADAGKAVVLKTDGTFEIGEKLGTMATESASDYTKTTGLSNLATDKTIPEHCLTGDCALVWKAAANGQPAGWVWEKVVDAD